MSVGENGDGIKHKKWNYELEVKMPISGRLIGESTSVPGFTQHRASNLPHPSDPSKSRET